MNTEVTREVQEVPVEAVDVQGELASIVSELDSGMKQIDTEAVSDLSSTIREAFTEAVQGLSALRAGAEKTINELLTGKTEEEQKEGVELTPEQLQKLATARTIISSVDEIHNQTGLLVYVSCNRIPVNIAETVSLAEREFEKLRHVLRTYKVEGFSYESIFSILKKNRHNPHVRKFTAFLYYFLRYLNQLKKDNAFVNNLIYARYTSTIISTALLGGMALPVLDNVYEILQQSDVSKEVPTPIDAPAAVESITEQ